MIMSHVSLSYLYYLSLLLISYQFFIMSHNMSRSYCLNHFNMYIATKGLNVCYILQML